MSNRFISSNHLQGNGTCGPMSRYARVGSKAEKLGMSTICPVCPRKRTFDLRARLWVDASVRLHAPAQRGHRTRLARWWFGCFLREPEPVIRKHKPWACLSGTSDRRAMVGRPCLGGDFGEISRSLSHRPAQSRSHTRCEEHDNSKNTLAKIKGAKTTWASLASLPHAWA